jgi:LmbE family N-acetylglucosaminyl deacetylase
MEFANKAAGVFIPVTVGAAPGTNAEVMARTTDLCIGAHQDDIEIMAYGPIAACYGNGGTRSDPHTAGRAFAGVTVTDGGGSPRTGTYAEYTDEQMKQIRAEEQNNAAQIGRYTAQFNLAWPSGGVKDPTNRVLVEEIKAILIATSPQTVYTHNLADKHDTHVAVAMHTIRAIRELPADKRPRLVGMEVWRALDWLCDEDKTVLNTAPYPNLAAALLGVYDSQISGGKRYDLATIGRRLSNATFFASHAVDDYESAAFGLDMTPLVRDNPPDAAAFIEGYIEKFRAEVEARVKKLI